MILEWRNYKKKAGKWEDSDKISDFVNKDHYDTKMICYKLENEPMDSEIRKRATKK